MPDSDLTNRLEDMFSDVSPEPEAEGAEAAASSEAAASVDDGSLIEGIVAELLGDEVVTEGSTPEPAKSEALLSTQTQTEEEGDSSLLEGVVARLVEDGPVTRRDVAETVRAEAPPDVMAEQEGAETPAAQSQNAVPVSVPQVTPREQRARLVGILPHVSFVLLGLFLVLLVIGLIRPVFLAGSGLRALLLVGCVVAFGITLMQWRLNVSLVSALQETEEEQAEAVSSQKQFERRVTELATVNTSLQERALEFQRANQVFNTLNSALDPDKLVREAVNLVRGRFDLYYVGLFLIDETGQWAELRACTLDVSQGQPGESSHVMLLEGYQLKVGSATAVGRCIDNGRAIITPDLGKEAFEVEAAASIDATASRDDTLLPVARSEMTLPLLSGGRLIGVLDLQSIEPGAFVLEDVEVFQTVTDRLAIAIDDAQAFAELKARLAAAEGYQRSSGRGQQAALAPATPHPALYERTRSGAASFGYAELPEVAQALAQRKLVVRPDAAASAEAGEGADHTALVAPITLRDELIGTIGFLEEDGRHWTADEIALVEDVTTQVGLAVENVRLFEQTQTALEETDALYRASRAIASADDVEGIVRAIVGSLTAPRIDQCFLGIFDSPGGKLVDDLIVAASWSHVAEPLWKVGTQLSLNQDLMGERVGRDRPLIVSDVAAAEGKDQAKRDELVSADIHSLAVVPLVAVGGWIGVLALAASQPGAITERNLQPYLTLAGQAALSIERSSLFNQTKEALEETSMLYRASRAIGAATSIPDVTDVLLDAVGEAYYERGLVLVRRQVDDKFEAVAGWDRSGRTLELGALVDSDQVSPDLAIWTQGDDVPGGDVPSGAPRDAATDQVVPARDRVWQQWISDMPEVTLASVPIQFRGQLLGVLLVARRPPSGREDQLDEKALQPFVTLTAQAAVAIENRRLFEEASLAAEQEALLNEMLRNLATALDVPAIIRTVQDPLTRLLPFDHMSVALLDKETSTLEVFYPEQEQIGEDTNLSKGRVVSVQDTLTGQVMPVDTLTQSINRWQTAVLDLADPGLEGLEVERLRRAGIQTCIIIPMAYGREMLGSLSLAHSSPDAYRDVDLPLLERVAQLMAIAVENARLFNQLSQRAVQLQTAAQVSQAATSILSLDQLMTETVELIQDQFNLYYVGLFMVDEANEWAVLRAGTGEAGQIQMDQGHQLKIGGDSMVGWCVANAQSRVAVDVVKEAGSFDSSALPDTRSELALPLISRGETIGALSVQSTSEAAFSREDRTTLQTMADQLANAIQNARFFEQTEKALAETESLYLASAELNTAQSYEDVLDAARRHTLIGEGAHNVSLNLFDRPWAGDQVPEWVEVLARWTELPPEALSPRYLLSDIPSAAQLLSLDAPTLIEDVANDARLDDNTRTFYLERFDGKSVLFAPLVVGGQWIGYMSAIYREPTTFLEAEVRRLTSLSGQAAVVVQGLRQLHEIQARARREVLIREITGKIRASTDLETILKTTVSEVSGALGTSHGAIRLGTPEGAEAAASVEAGASMEEGNSREGGQE